MVSNGARLSDLSKNFTFGSLSAFRILCVTLTGLGCDMANADAVKYREANGQIVISNVGASGGAKVVSVYEAENISQSQQQKANSDLERQRQFVEARERERYIANSQPSGAKVIRSNTVVSPDPAEKTKIYACLSKITAIFGLSPSEEARRKVGCYVNTSGTQSDCEDSVAATMRLSSYDESQYKAQCRMVASR
jgi:hypothetical protein